MTIGVYGLVAGIVKLDDAGLHLIKDNAATTWASSKRMFGRGLLIFAPYLMKSLSVIGTAAMFMVGGGILLHGIPASHDVLHTIENAVHSLPALGGFLALLAPSVAGAVVGVAAGAAVLAVVKMVSAMRNRNVPLILFMLLYIVNAAVESILEVQAGVVFFALFLGLLVAQARTSPSARPPSFST